MPPEPLAFRDVNSERKSDEETDNRNHEEADAREDKANDDGPPRDACVAQAPAGHEHLDDLGTAISTVAATSTAHAVAEPTVTAQTAIAAHASTAPGSTGTTTPAIPTATASPTRKMP